MKLPKIDKNQPIAIDLETCDPELTTLAPGYITGVGFVAGIPIAAKEGAWYIPINHTEGKNYDDTRDLGGCPGRKAGAGSLGYQNKE